MWTRYQRSFRLDPYRSRSDKQLTSSISLNNTKKIHVSSRYWRKTLAKEHHEERAKRLVRERERGRKRRADETPEQRTDRLSKRKLEISKCKVSRQRRISREQCLFGAAVPILHTMRGELYRSRTAVASSGAYIVGYGPKFAPVRVQRYRRHLHHDVRTHDEIVVRRRQRHSSMMNQA